MSLDDENTNEGFSVKGAVSLIFAILCFLEIVFLVSIYMNTINQSFEFSDDPLIRFVVLIVSFFVSRMFFNYLNDDMTKFKYFVMTVFIIIFIITLFALS